MNPLAPGHLTPYRTQPGEGAQDRREERRRTGRACSAAVPEAVLSSSKPSIGRLCRAGRWHGGYPVTPALITSRSDAASRTRRARAGRLGRTPVGAKERATLGRLRSRGHQNWPVFDSQHHVPPPSPPPPPPPSRRRLVHVGAGRSPLARAVSGENIGFSGSDSAGTGTRPRHCVV